MTTFKNFINSLIFALKDIFSPTDDVPMRESKFFIILVTSISRNKSQTLYAVSCILNLPQLLHY